MNLRVRSSLLVWSSRREDNRLGLSLRIFSRPFRSKRHGRREAGRRLYLYGYDQPGPMLATRQQAGAAVPHAPRRRSRRVLVFFETVGLCKRSILRIIVPDSVQFDPSDFKGSFGFICHLRKRRLFATRVVLSLGFSICNLITR